MQPSSSNSTVEANQTAIEVSTLQLVRELCLQVFAQSKNPPTTNPLLSTFQAPTKQAVWSTRDDSSLISSLVRMFFDTLLLRRWEWYGLASRTSTMSPACRCMSFGYHLLCQGRHNEAGHLIEAVTSLTGERRVLREPEAILMFLSLMAQVNVDTTQVAPLAQPVKKDEQFRYEVYSSSFFEKPPHHSYLTDLNNDFSQSLSLFKSAPGTGFNSFLFQPPRMDDKAISLYDGLVHSTVEDVNTPLGLPCLPTDHDDLTLMPHIEPVDLLPGSLSKELPADSHTSSLSISITTLSPESSTVELLSSLSSDTTTHTIREWEGWKIGSKQYLCDNSGGCFPHALELCLSRHCSLAGVELSDVKGGESLASGVIKTLDTLPMATLNTFEEGGSVLWMLGKAVQSLLDYFRAQLHQLAGDSTELRLSLSSHWILPTVRFLMDVWNDVENLPKGLALLDILYAQACQVQGTPHYLLLLNLLAQSLAPYFKFVEQWVFQGWLDLGEEFGLHATEEALGRRDEEYWSKGYTLSGESGCAPGFLASQVHTILTCGKALNLLRICKPSHPLCTGMFHTPKLRVQLSRRGLEQSNVQCQHYGREVQENEQVRQDLLQQELLEKEKELRAEVLKARQEARAHAEKLRKLEEAYQAQEQQKKVILRTELLEQIRANQVLRSEQEAEERQQDKERLDYLTSRETLQTDREAALQEKAREEMIAYYAELSREAELRQHRAEWRAKRYELSTHRFEFLRKEKEKITAELSQRSSNNMKTPATPMTVHQLTQPQPGKASLPAVPISLDTSQSGESVVPTEPLARRTWTESNSQTEQTSRKTWIASMIDQPMQIDAITDPKPAVEAHKHERDSEPLELIQEDNNENQESVFTEVTFTSHSPTPQPMPTVRSPVHQPSVAQDLIYNWQTTDPATLCRLNQITASNPHLQCSSKEQPSVVQELIYPTEHAQLEQRKAPVSSRGCEDPSTAQDIIYGTMDHNLENHVHSRGSGPESTAQDIIYGTSLAGLENHVHSRGSEPESTAQDIIYGTSLAGLENHVHSRGSEPESTAQDIIYGTSLAGSSSSPVIQESGHPRLVSSRGHAPESTAQIKMYPLRYIEQVKEKETTLVSDESEQAKQPKMEFTSYRKYRDEFSCLRDTPTQDMLTAVLGPPSQDYTPDDIDTEFLSVYPMSALLEQSLALPILTQSTLVNQALLRYFLTECRIVHHFTVLKWFLLLEDGEFGHALSTRLCEELAYGRNWKLLCSASFLNPILTSALEVAVHSHCPEAQRISFFLKYRPTSVNTQAIDALEFLQLKYEVDWPCNIVITNSAIERYNRILQLLLQLKRASWALKNTFHQLKVCRDLSATQTRQLQVYRHEYQHFVNVMHGYIANQVFQITWREFEADLQNEVHSFEELIQAHHNFVNKVIFRCLLSKKALPLMKLIHNIFSSILKFSNQLSGGAVNVQRGYAAMCETHMRFKEVSGLLIKVVDKLVQRGYQPHLEDFLLRLDFNKFYKQ